MGPTTDTASLSVQQFYDELADDYDRMTGFEKRFVQEGPFFRLLVDTHMLKTAVDAGSGTGFHALLLAQLGVRVTAVDLSGNMLARLREHAAEMGLPVATLQAPFAELPAHVKEPVDAVVCLGNSLAHLPSPEELARALESFARITRPGGILFAQLMNYERILSSRTRVLSVREESGTVFVRFYDFLGETIRFNVMRILRAATKPEAEISSMMLRPVLLEELRRHLEESGFTNVRAYGSVAMEEYAPADSRDLVVLARRS
jgi:SAM-dependent methyltransferase